MSLTVRYRGKTGAIWKWRKCNRHWGRLKKCTIWKWTKYHGHWCKVKNGVIWNWTKRHEHLCGVKNGTIWKWTKCHVCRIGHQGWGIPADNAMKRWKTIIQHRSTLFNGLIFPHVRVFLLLAILTVISLLVEGGNASCHWAWLEHQVCQLFFRKFTKLMLICVLYFSDIVLITNWCDISNFLYTRPYNQQNTPQCYSAHAQGGYHLTRFTRIYSESH